MVALGVGVAVAQAQFMLEAAEIGVTDLGGRPQRTGEFSLDHIGNRHSIRRAVDLVGSGKFEARQPGHQPKTVTRIAEDRGRLDLHRIDDAMHAARLGAFDGDTQRSALAHQSEGVQRPAILPQAVNIEAVEAGQRLGAIHGISAQRVRGQAVDGELQCCGHGSLPGPVVWSSCTGAGR